MRNEIIKALVVWGMVLLFWGLPVYCFAKSIGSPEAYTRIWGTCVECGKYIPDVTGFGEAGMYPICGECDSRSLSFYRGWSTGSSIPAQRL